MSTLLQVATEPVHRLLEVLVIFVNEEEFSHILLIGKGPFGMHTFPAGDSTLSESIMRSQLISTYMWMDPPSSLANNVIFFVQRYYIGAVL